MSAEGGSGPLQLLLGTAARPASAAGELRARLLSITAEASRGGRPASPDGMPTAMLPYACVLVLLGGRCCPPSLHRLAARCPSSEGRELAVGCYWEARGDCCVGLWAGQVMLRSARSWGGGGALLWPHLACAYSTSRVLHHRAVLRAVHLWGPGLQAPGATPCARPGGGGGGASKETQEDPRPTEQPSGKF